MIEWLGKAFGFEHHLVVPADGDTIAHAQLTFGNSMIMLGSVQANEYGRLMKQPAEIDGAETQGAVYHRRGCRRSLHTRQVRRGRDCDGHQRRGLRWTGFTCRDPEGHIWNFGTYDPWQE